MFTPAATVVVKYITPLLIVNAVLATASRYNSTSPESIKEKGIERLLRPPVGETCLCTVLIYFLLFIVRTVDNQGQQDHWAGDLDALL
jgi:hypothetical protein